MADIQQKNEVNKALIELGKLKWTGLNKTDLIGAVAKALKTKSGKELISKESNEAQIMFAKLVWNESNESTRRLMLSQPTKWFLEIATDSKMVPLLSKALEAYTQGVGGGGDGDATAYLEIAAKVQAAKAKKAKADADPYAEGLTAGEKRMIEKFDRLEKEREGRDYEEHHPNENAVTYPFILGKMIVMTGMKLDSITMVKKTVCDILKYFAVHGQKTVRALTVAIANQTKIVGPDSKKDVLPLIKKILESDEFVTASEASTKNKLLSNSVVTLKRIVRLIHICTPHKTVWGLMEKTGKTDSFPDLLTNLFNLEEKVGSPDMNSLSMIWYLCIGRSNLCSVMVDHWEESASNKLAELLDSSQQDAFLPPTHVFPLDKDVTEKFPALSLEYDNIKNL